MTKEWFMKFRERFTNEPEPEFFQFRSFMPNLRAEIAIEMVKRFALIAGTDGGEDSAGRHHISLMPEDECVRRAVRIADGIVTEVENQGWLEATPSYQEWLDKAMGAHAQKEQESEARREAKRRANELLSRD